MDWLKIASGFPDHRKVQELKAALEEPLAEAYPLRIMAWLSRNNSKDGMIGASFVLEEVARWRGPAGALTKAMLKTGMVKGGKEGLAYHDWSHHNGEDIGAYEAKLKRDRERNRAIRRGDVAATTERRGQESLDPRTDGRTDGRNGTPPTPLNGGHRLRPREVRKAIAEKAKAEMEGIREARVEWDLRRRRMDQPFFKEHGRTPTDAEASMALGCRP